MENTNDGEGPHGNNVVEPNVKSLFTILNDSISPCGRGGIIVTY